jgi:hypothetical protein
MLNLSWRAFTFGGLICSASRRHSQPESEMLEALLSGRGRQGVGVTHNRLFCPRYCIRCGRLNYVEPRRINVSKTPEWLQ